VYVPELIFGHLLTSSNYNDNERKVTGGRNGYGAKLCNIFSTEFIVETGTPRYLPLCLCTGPPNCAPTWALQRTASRAASSARCLARI
jgi:hypothetical protein